MLLRENYTADHINSMKDATAANLSIIERTVFAFGLLEAICKVGMPFVFKGGTSLLILLNEPKRLSTDIDIVVKCGIDVDKYIAEAGKIFPFIGIEEQSRRGTTDIVKRHFKFRFLSPITSKEFYILLDVVYEDNFYSAVSDRPIRNRLLLCEGEDLCVKVPDKNSVLADKLTAFAPHTTGIPFGVGKNAEIMKQMFDCYTLLQEMDDYETVASVYNKVSLVELLYRNLKISPKECLKDTIRSCLCLIGRGSVYHEDYGHFSNGIIALRGHIFAGKLSNERAASYACEVMYLAACLLTEQKRYERVKEPNIFRDVHIAVKGLRKLRGIRNSDPIAYAYLIKSLQLLLATDFFAEIWHD